MKEPQPMREIHEIQKRIYEEEKNMTSQERMVKMRLEASELIKKYGLKFKTIGDVDKVA